MGSSLGETPIPVNINTASKAELCKVKGITQTVAGLILVAHRSKDGCLTEKDLRSIPYILNLIVDQLLESHSVYFGPPDSSSLPLSSDGVDEGCLVGTEGTGAMNTIPVSSLSDLSLSYDRGHKLILGQRHSLIKKYQYTQRNNTQLEQLVDGLEQLVKQLGIVVTL